MLISRKPLKLCHKAGCNELIRDNTYCDKHTDDRIKYYDKYERNQDSKRFYNSKEWKRVRAYVIARDKGLCVECLKNKKFTKFDVVDHITPLLVDWSLALSPSNLDCKCHSCHNKKTAEDKEKY